MRYKWECYGGSGSHKTWAVYAVGADGSKDLVVVCAYKIGAIKLCERLNEYERRAQ